MKHDLLPHEVDALLSTHAPLSSDPEFISTERMRQHRARHDELLRATRNAHAGGFRAAARQILTMVIVAVFMVFLIALHFALVTPSSGG